MYMGSIESGRIINAFLRSVPGTYVRDYRANGGYIVVCKDYRTIKWKDQLSTAKVYKQVPATTLVNLPRGNVTPDSKFMGLKMHRPGWRLEFRRASKHLSHLQKRQITRMLGCGEVFYGVV